MTATAAPQYVRITADGGIWLVTAVSKDGIASLRHTSLLHDCPGHRLHGRPGETSAPMAQLIPVETATHGTTDAPAVEAAGASSSRPGGPLPGAGTAAGLVLPADPAAPHRHARNTDPEPAHTAAAKAQTHAAQSRCDVLFAHIDAGDNGLTGEELETVIGRPYKNIGPRRPWLCDNGFIVKTAITRLNKDDNAMGVYVVTEAGVAMGEQLAAEGWTASYKTEEAA
jgi:hypothetical protein